MPRYAAKRRADATFTYATSTVETLPDNCPFDDLLNLSRKRSERTEYIHPTSVVFRADGTLDNGMQFSSPGFSRFCSAIEVPRRFVEELSRTNAQRTAAEAVQHMMRMHAQEVQLVVVDNVIEGAVSPKYMRIANSDILNILAEEVGSVAEKFSVAASDLRVHRARFEGTRMSVDLLCEIIAKEHCLPGDPVKSGVNLFNAEDGTTAEMVSAILYRLVCKNGAIAPSVQSSGRLVHRGGNVHDKTRDLIGDAVDNSIETLGRIRPAVEVNMDKDRLHQWGIKLSEAFSITTAREVHDHSRAEATKRSQYGVNGMISAYDYWNGITFQAHAAPDITTGRKIESFGGQFLSWAHKTWLKAPSEN